MAPYRATPAIQPAREDRGARIAALGPRLHARQAGGGVGPSRAVFVQRVAARHLIYHRR